MHSDTKFDINGDEVRVILSRENAPKAPLFVYIKGAQEFPQFGGYVYSIKDKSDRVYQVTLKDGDCEEMARSLGRMLGMKYQFPNYCNINGIRSMDYNFLLVRLNELMKPLASNE